MSPLAIATGISPVFEGGLDPDAAADNLEYVDGDNILLITGDYLLLVNP